MAEPLHVIGDLRAWAVEYARQGFEIFPVHAATKQPMAVHVYRAPSQYKATTDVDTVAAWWDRWPDALIGHRLPDEHIILDIDPRHGGADTWRALKAHYGIETPQTRLHVSGRNDGGGHMWFLRPAEKLTISKLDDWAKEHGTGHAVLDKEGNPTEHWVCGLDLLHRMHRYTILPPSPHPVTLQPYRWHQWADVGPAHPAIAELLIDDSPPPPPYVPKEYDGDSIADWFSAKYGVAEILHRHGWHLRSVGSGDADGARWQHPTATSPVSATVRHGCLFVYSPNTPFDVTAPGDPHGYTSFRVFAELDHGGDLSAAAKTARELKGDGFAARPTVPAFTPPPRTDVNPETGEITIEVPKETPWVLPEAFWSARPVLGHIRTAAHSRIRSADLVLHGVLARLSAYTPHTFELPALAGSAGSLNYFTIAVGPSGAGKSSGSSIADELLPRPADVEDKPLGSGEGLAENYMGTVMEEDEKGKQRPVRRQVLHNVFVYGDEGAALTEMMQRKGATLPEALRRAWTGGSLGQSNATAERTRVIPAGSYRLGVLIGFQPEIAAELMADAIAGTPQRFTFSWAGDPNIPEPHAIPDWPGELEVPRPLSGDIVGHTITRGGFRRVQLSVEDDIRTEVVADAVRRARGEAVGVALDSHQPLHLLKLSGLLALLDGRLHIDLEDWELAHMIWATSCAVRAGVEAAVAAQQERTETARITSYARREGAAEAARSGAANDVVRVARLIARRAFEDPQEEGHTKRQLGQFCASRDRHLLDAAISHAEAHEWLSQNALGRFDPGESRPS